MKNVRVNDNYLEKDLQHILVIDDERNMRHMLEALLTGNGYQVDCAADGREGLEMVGRKEYDFVLCDIRMPRLDGMEFLRRSRGMTGAATIIMMSAFGTVDSAIKAMKEGAYDYISKPFKTDEILLTLNKAKERERLRAENNQLRMRLASMEDNAGFPGMIARSTLMKELFRLARKVARHQTTVLITGESGTGKELIAQGIHHESPRRRAPFLAVNCGSIPDSLLENEFFGHVRGAFTGADCNRKGLFEQAQGGTLFLDEIGELPVAMQVKLLRVLQERHIRRVGGNREYPVDIRILCATSRDLALEVREGRFREDLYFRLNVVEIHLPSLRERPEDIPLLADHFLGRVKTATGLDIKGISPSALSRLVAYQWPGNVRELENVIERAAIMAEKQVIQPENLPGILAAKSESRRIDDYFHTYSIKKAKKIMEKRLIIRALEAADGNKSRASELLEISYPSLLGKIKKYGI
ncbi:sigma-54-dependent transcriptional regulator [Thermodesulfobacteriota bacterium B35]